MQHQLPPLPYGLDALEPHISRETMEFHYGKHHKAYVDKLNELIKGKPQEQMTLEEIVRNSAGPMFNNAAQVWNHTFFWQCMSPEGGSKPEGAFAQAIDGSFGSMDKFKDEFSSSAIAVFGSGWTWLVTDESGKLTIKSTQNAHTPIEDNAVPLLTCDVWEHAYYIDYRNARPQFVKAFWNVVNWQFAARNYENRGQHSARQAAGLQGSSGSNERSGAMAK
jgi:Fe-Mn family superoxide dismutase